MNKYDDLLQGVRDAKRKAESVIAKATTEAVAAFEAETGLFVSAIEHARDTLPSEWDAYGNPKWANHVNMVVKL